MEKKIEDYLHLYMGCDVMTDQGIWRLTGIDKEQNLAHCCTDEYFTDYVIEYLEPILRPLSDMTAAEDIEWTGISYYNEVVNDEIIFGEAERTQYLISRHFDLFGLIEAGLAIDKTKLNK